MPASHEDPKNPGALKIVLGDASLIHPDSHLQMINWAKLPPHKHFESHYHEDMDEIFIILSGKSVITVGGEQETLGKGDGVVVPMKNIHRMENTGDSDVLYIAIGFSKGKGGRTINVEPVTTI